MQESEPSVVEVRSETWQDSCPLTLEGESEKRRLHGWHELVVSPVVWLRAGNGSEPSDWICPQVTGADAGIEVGGPMSHEAVPVPKPTLSVPWESMVAFQPWVIVQERDGMHDMEPLQVQLTVLRVVDVPLQLPANELDWAIATPGTESRMSAAAMADAGQAAAVRSPLRIEVFLTFSPPFCPDP